MSNHPHIEKIIVGLLETNCYLVSSNKEAIIFDPADNLDLILKKLDGNKLKYIILTHCHFDHILACKDLKVNTKAKIIAHKDEVSILDRRTPNVPYFSFSSDNMINISNIDIFAKEGDVVSIGNFKFKIIHTPGHTPGGICLYEKNAKILFSGDTIFAGTFGVTQYPGGDLKQIKESIEKKLFTLPDDILVYPGHGREFVLGEERENIRRMLG